MPAKSVPAAAESEPTLSSEPTQVLEVGGLQLMLTVDAQTIVRNPRATIDPDDVVRDSGRRAADALFEGLKTDASHERVEFRDTLGQGGMGVVHLATQKSLGREVAAKTLKPELANDVSRQALLREAWLTGALEHPNIVPVYDIAVSGGGQPVIVLKRIEGRTWTELLNDPDEVARSFGTDDLLEWNLSVFEQVCNAVHFAHSRGIVHRDLKPDNVMIGAFGEVYLMDLGLAVSLRDDGTGRFPLARNATQLAGTPNYMAPEMLGAEGFAPLSERTDVYLLGAVLYELVVGCAPHQGDTFEQLVSSIVLSTPKFPGVVPEPLADVVRAAMSVNPDERPASAEELRRDVERYKATRGSLRLAAQAQLRVDELLKALQERRSQADSVDAELYNLYGAARFGFREALKAWADNPQARAGLREAALAMARYELGQGDAKGAEAVLVDIQDVPDELSAKIEAARERHAREAAEVDRLRRDADPAVGARTRGFFMAVLGTLFGLAPMVMHFMPSVDVTNSRIAGLAIFWLLLVGGLAFWARETLSRGALNRRVLGVLAIGLVGTMIWHSFAGELGLSALRALAADLLMWAAGCGAVALILSPWIAVLAGVYAAAFVAAVYDPNRTLLYMSLSNFAMLFASLAMAKHALTESGQKLFKRD